MAYPIADTGVVARRSKPDEDPDDPYLSRYLSRIRQYALLTAEEEIQLGKAMEAGQRAERWLTKGALALDDAMHWEMERRRRAARQARDKFLVSNLRLVVNMAAKLGRGSGMELPDLIQAGNLGLIRAVDKWDWSRGFRFSTYATFWIRQAVTREISNHSRTIRIPVYLWENVRKYRKVYEKRYEMTGEPPTMEQMSGDMNIPLIEVIRLRNALQDMLSWEEVAERPIPGKQHHFDDPDNPAIFQENGKFGEHWEDFSAAERLICVETSSDFPLPEWASWLTAREKAILTLRFGFDGGEPRTLEEIGQEYSLTEERIRQLLKAALGKLRRPSAGVC